MNRYLLKHSWLWPLVSIMVVALLMPWSISKAQSNPQEHLAVILILDNSGSMTTSDPTDLRYTAAQLFVALLDQGDAVGALRFSTTSTPITNGIEAIENSEQQSQLVESLAAVSPEGFTDIKAVFEQAQQMVQSFDQTGYKLIVIFLTDGRPEIENKYATYDQEALDAANSLNIPILSIALTDSGQSPFLNQVASDTGGQVIFAKEATDLLDIYLQILGNLKDRTVIGNGNISAPGEVVLPLESALIPYVDRVSFVISKPSSVSDILKTPDGQTVSGSSPGVDFAIQDRRFSVFTLSQLVGGDWRFELNGNGEVQARAILYSRLRVRLVSPQNVFEAGQPLPLVVKLVEEQPGQTPVNIIGQASFSALITLPDNTQDSLDQFYDDGTNGDTQAGDGLYTRQYVDTDQTGTYQILIKGFKGSIPVTNQTQIQGVGFPELVLDQPQLAQYDIRSNLIPLQIHLAGAGVNELDKGSFVALVTTPGGSIERFPLTYTNNAYIGEYSPVENGTYQVDFEPMDATYQGLPYNHSVKTSFEVTIVPQIKIQDAHLVLGEPFLSKQMVELSTARQGILVALSAASTSSNDEKITAHLENMPGYSLIGESQNFIVAPGQGVTLNLRIQADPNVPVGSVNGKLVFTAQTNIDVINSEIPLLFTTFEPKVDLTYKVISEVSKDSCTQWQPIQIIITSTSSSLITELIDLKWVGVPNTLLESKQIQIQPGHSEGSIVLKPMNGKFSSGDYQGTLQFTSQRIKSGELNISPEEPIKIAFSVDPFWKSCQSQIISWSIGIIVGIILLWILIRIFLWWVNRRLNE